MRILRRVDNELMSEQKKAFTELFNEGVEKYNKNNASIIWDMARSDEKLLRKIYPDVPAIPGVLDKLRILTAYPIINGTTFRFKEDLRIVFRTENIGTGETSSVHYLLPSNYFPLSLYRGDKKLMTTNISADQKFPLTDPIILGNMSAIDRLRFDDDATHLLIKELSICCELIDGIAIQSIDPDVPVFVYTDLETILNASLVPVEHLNIWVRSDDEMDCNEVYNEIKTALTGSCVVLEVAFYENSPDEAIWCNTDEDVD
jgi:hypothetical protein